MGMKKKHASEDCIRGNVCEKKNAAGARTDESGQATKQCSLRETPQDHSEFLTQTSPWITLHFPGKNLLDTPWGAQSKPGKLGITQMYSYFRPSIWDWRGTSLKPDLSEGHAIHMEQQPKCVGIIVNEVIFLWKEMVPFYLLMLKKICNSFTVFGGTT